MIPKMWMHIHTATIRIIDAVHSAGLLQAYPYPKCTGSFAGWRERVFFYLYGTNTTSCSLLHYVRGSKLTQPEQSK